MKSVSMILLNALLVSGALADTRALDQRWSIDVPADWWYTDTQNRGSLRIYTFGAGTPDPLRDAPVTLVDAAMRGTTCELIRGISLGIARVPVTTVVIEGTEKIIREQGWLREGYRKEVKAIDGHLLLHVFVFPANLLPGDPLPDSDARLVMVQIAGKSAEEVEQFTRIVEGMKAIAGKP